MAVVGFPLWDAPGFGSPWLRGVSTQWSGGELHTVTLGRCRGELHTVMLGRCRGELHTVTLGRCRGELHTVTLGRCRGEPRDDVADVSVSTSKPGWSATPHQALTVGALLAFAPGLSAAGELTGREAAVRLVELAHGPGLPVLLWVAGSEVDARRFEVPVTGDWAVTAVDTRLPVCVAGRCGLAVPELKVADQTRWAVPLRAQIAEATAR